jgi:nondiscriminating aspartyl-tRNA synthetase
LASQVKDHLGQEIFLQGWIHQIRAMGKMTFILLRDRSGIIQGIVLDPEIKTSDLERETVVSIRGLVKAAQQARGGVEVEIKEISPICRPVAPVPFEVNRSLEKLNIKLDTILNHRAFSLRHPEIGRVFKVQAEIVNAFREYLRANDFLEIHTSKIVATGTEGGTALFPIQYFEQKAFLAQSPQFYKEMLVGAGYERVFEIGFVYRAEDHATARHINEYLSLDYEMGFIDSVEDVMDMEVGFLKYLFEALKKNCADELGQYKVELPGITTVPRMAIAEAKAILKKEFNKELSADDDLDPEGERLICDYAKKTFDSDFIFVTRYPTAVRPFYTMADPADGKFTLSFDLLYKGLEVTTGSQRIHDYDMLVNNIKKAGMNPENFEFYLEIFRYGMPPHGGLAIGAERLTQQILGLKNIREASFFPRDRFRLTP